MSLFTEYQDAIVAVVKARLPSLKTVQSHGGSVTESELRRWGASAPAVFVSVLGGRSAATRLPDNIDLTFCLYVVTRNSPVGGRDDLALNLVQGLNQVLLGQRFGLDSFVGLPAQIDSQNLFSTDLDKTGLSLWAITWQQTVELDTAVSLEALDDFIRAHVSYELGDEHSPVAEDLIILPTGATP